jgi:hypothetical protein
MSTFRAEIRTILIALQGSPWAIHPQVQEVIAEYTHFQQSGHTRTQTRRVSLQIFYASRAIDSLLKHMVEHEAIKVGTPITTYLTLKRSLNRVQSHSIGGRTFSTPVVTDIDTLITDRNRYMHQANTFPSDLQVQGFLNKTIRAINEAITFPP